MSDKMEDAVICSHKYLCNTTIDEAYQFCALLRLCDPESCVSFPRCMSVRGTIGWRTVATGASLASCGGATESPPTL